MNHLDLGKVGEEVAAKMLQLSKFKILERNYRVGWGEIDIVAEKEDVRYVLEVKTRTNLEYGRPVDAVGKHKRDKIKALATYYALVSNWEGGLQLGVIEVIYDMYDRKYRTNLILDDFR